MKYAKGFFITLLSLLFAFDLSSPSQYFDVEEHIPTVFVSDMASWIFVNLFYC